MSFLISLMNDENISKSARKTLGFLQRLGQVKYYNYDFTEEGPNYASIEIHTTRKIAEHLETEINRQLCRENGFEAFIRFIDRKEDDKKGRFEYVAEIVPYDNVDKGRLQEVTDYYLQSLPRTIRDFLIKNDCRDLAKNER